MTMNKDVHEINNDLKNQTEQEDLIYTLVLLQLPSVGPSRYWQLCDLFGSVKNTVFAELKSFPSAIPPETLQLLKQIQSNFSQHPIVQSVEASLHWCKENNVNIISLSNEFYPALLATIHSPPPVLYVRGNITNLSLPQLAVVGSRNPTPTGKENAFNFAKALSSSGFAITSGLALGIDAAAHQGAMAGGADQTGKTIAVLGSGIDKIYPRRHQKLAADIIENGGTIVSEFAVGVGPHASNFPRRNRIISGLSLGVLVVEAAIKSGSLITARLAMQQDREVFAIPGSIHNPLSRGGHSLIKDGATLVEQVSDLKDSLEGLLAYKASELKENAVDEAFESEPETTNINKTNREKSNHQENQITDLSETEKAIVKAMGFDEASFDTLVERLSIDAGNKANIDAGKLLSTLMTLELKGIILQTPTGYIRAIQEHFDR